MYNRSQATISLIVLVALVCFLPGIGLGKTRTAKCDKGKSLQKQIDKSKPGDTIQIRGTCKENVVIHESKSDLLLLPDEGSDATIEGGAGIPTVNVQGRGVTIQDLRITGGSSGIRVSFGGDATILGNTITGGEIAGVLVNNGAFAKIGVKGPLTNRMFDGNEIKNNNFGIVVTRSAGAEITDNVIRDNTDIGIWVNRNSAATIGGLFGDFTQGNTITGNGGVGGITVSNTSHANIEENHIDKNAGNGITVSAGSSASAEGNTIDGNGKNGIEVTENSTVRVSGNVTADAEKNLGAGLKCSVNSSAVGSLGELKGTPNFVAETDCTHPDF